MTLAHSQTASYQPTTAEKSLFVHGCPYSECPPDWCHEHGGLKVDCPATWCGIHNCPRSLCPNEERGGVSGGAETPATGEPSFGSGAANAVPVNNDDDDASGADDSGETPVAGENDLVKIYPLGPYDGQCCTCPEHRTKEGTQSADLVSLSGNLALYDDASKTYAFGGTARAGFPVYVEGLAASAVVNGDRALWAWTDANNLTHTVTNAFTVFSVRLFGDIGLDGDIDAADKALAPSLPAEYGWGMPAATNVFRCVRLRTDVRVPGDFALSVSGDTNAFRVWATDTPGAADAPLLSGGKTSADAADYAGYGYADLFVEALGNGTATLKYSYTGTDAADGLSCSAALKMTAFAYSVEFLAGGVTTTNALLVAKWENAFSNGYAQASGWTLTNAVFRQSEFIGGDEDRFHVRITDGTRTNDESVTVYVSTEYPGDSTYDASPRAVTLPRVSPGVFMSTNLLLVSDWNDASFDAVAYGVAPGSTNRLFLSQLSGRVSAAYGDSWGNTNVMRAAVGAEVKAVTVDVAIMRTNGEACVDAQTALAQVVLAKERLAQANIVVNTGTLVFFDAPPDVDLAQWQVVDTNDSHSLSSDARSVIHQALVSVTNESDNICLIFVPSVRSTLNTPVAGHTTASYWYTRSIDSPYVDHCLISVSAIVPFVSAHELCHALDVRAHEAEKCNLMFATASPFTDVDSTKRLKKSQTDRIWSGDHVQ